VSLRNQWEQVRDACELLQDLAIAQVQNNHHPDAATVVQWLDHVGRVAARESGACADVAAAPPHGGYLQ